MDRVPKWGGAAKAAPSFFIVENGKWKVESWGGTARSDRGVGDAAPYGGTYKVCVGAAALPRPTMDTAFSQNCHSEERSDMGIRFLLCGSAVRGEYGLPRAFHALAMTGLWWVRRVVGGGTMWASSYALVRGGRRVAGQFTLFSYFPCCKICRKIL